VEPQEITTDRELTSGRAPGNRRTTMRVIRKGQGMILIYESEPSATAPGSRALVFESAHGSAKTDVFPLDWRFLADEELLQLQPHQA
jgi:hypothetical protein